MEDTLLCPELLDKIFSFLESKDLLKAAEVSETWKSIARLSLKRRLFLQVHDVDPDDEIYFLKFRKREHQGPAKLIDVDEDDEDIEESDLENLKFDGKLLIPLGSEAHKNLPLLAILYMPDSWSLKITKLDFVDHGDSEDDSSDDSEDDDSDDSENEDLVRSLAVQDWNTAGTHILGKFPCLKKLNLHLEWIPNYVSTLEVPVVPQGIFDSIEKISINFLGLHHCEYLNLQFATWCPNLKKLRIYGYDEDHDIIFVAKFKNFAWKEVEGVKKFKIFAHRGDKILSPIWKALVPVLKTLSFTFVKLDCSVETLQLFDASVAAKIKALCVILHSKTVKAVAKDVDFVLAALCNGGFSALEDLQLEWTETDGEDSDAPGENAEKTDFSLLNIKRLQLGGIDLGWEDADWSPTNKRLLKSLPNLELLVVHSSTPMNNLLPENIRCSTRGIYPISFLKYASEFKQLRHLVWDWDFCRKNMAELRRLRKVPKYLARLQSLESLTIRLAGSKSLPPLEAVVEGCAALPRMRSLDVYARYNSELAQSPELLEHLISKTTAFCIRMLRRNYNLNYADFQIDSLDKRPGVPEPE